MTDLEQEESRLSYALSKQLSTAFSVQSTYGDLELDDEMRLAIGRALRPILTRRLALIKGPGKARAKGRAEMRWARQQAALRPGSNPLPNSDRPAPPPNPPKAPRGGCGNG